MYPRSLTSFEISTSTAQRMPSNPTPITAPARPIMSQSRTDRATRGGGSDDVRGCVVSG